MLWQHLTSRTEIVQFCVHDDIQNTRRGVFTFWYLREKSVGLSMLPFSLLSSLQQSKVMLAGISQKNPINTGYRFHEHCYKGCRDVGSDVNEP